VLAHRATHFNIYLRACLPPPPPPLGRRYHAAPLASPTPSAGRVQGFYFIFLINVIYLGYLVYLDYLGLYLVYLDLVLGLYLDYLVNVC
jgi:hypothetical protein